MFISSATSFEIATVNDIALVAGDVEKVTRLALPDRGSAEALCGQLETYHAALAAGPLAVPELVSTDVLEQADGFHVRHVVEFVEGTPVSRLPYDERRTAVNGLVRTVGEMPQHSPGNVETPFDARLRNIVKHDSELVLVDVCPSFEWGNDGLVKTALMPDMGISQRLANTGVMGSKTGVMAEMFAGIAPERHSGESEVDHARRVVATAPQWYADVVPSTLTEVQREDLDVRVEVKLRARIRQAYANEARQDHPAIAL
jgi:hypothetical protein